MTLPEPIEKMLPDVTIVFATLPEPMPRLLISAMAAKSTSAVTKDNER